MWRKPDFNSLLYFLPPGQLPRGDVGEDLGEAEDVHDTEGPEPQGQGHRALQVSNIKLVTFNAYLSDKIIN